MEYLFFAGILAAWLAAAGVGAYVALRNLKTEWGESFTLKRLKADSVAPATVPETPHAKRRATR